MGGAETLPRRAFVIDAHSVPFQFSVEWLVRVAEWLLWPQRQSVRIAGDISAHGKC